MDDTRCQECNVLMCVHETPCRPAALPPADQRETPMPLETEPPCRKCGFPKSAHTLINGTFWCGTAL